MRFLTDIVNPFTSLFRSSIGGIMYPKKMDKLEIIKKVLDDYIII